MGRGRTCNTLVPNVGWESEVNSNPGGCRVLGVLLLTLQPISHVQSGDRNSIYNLRFLARPNRDPERWFQTSKVLSDQREWPHPQQHPSVVRWGLWLRWGGETMEWGRFILTRPFFGTTFGYQDPGRNSFPQAPPAFSQGLRVSFPWVYHC